MFSDDNYDWVQVKRELDFATKQIDFTELLPELSFIETIKNTKAQKIEDVIWSSLIPEMGELCTDNIENKAASELAHIALAWALLHEIQHIKLQRKGTASDLNDQQGCHNEEFICDKFAFDYLISEISNYANCEPGTDEYRIILKRELGIMFALFSMIVSNKDNWNETKTHPKLQDRLSRIEQCLSTEEAKHISKNMFLVLQGNNGWSSCPCT